MFSDAKMDELSPRFFILQRQFVGFSDSLPDLIRAWLVKQQVNCLEIHVTDLLKIIMLPDGPQRKHHIVCLALTNNLSFIPFVKCTGNTVVFSNIQATLVAQWPARVCAAIDRSIPDNRIDTQDAIARLERLQGEQLRRLALIESCGKEQERRNTEQRRIQARIASNELALATQEISRLRAELDSSPPKKVNHVHVSDTVAF